MHKLQGPVRNFFPLHWIILPIWNWVFFVKNRKLQGLDAEYGVLFSNSFPVREQRMDITWIWCWLQTNTFDPKAFNSKQSKLVPLEWTLVEIDFWLDSILVEIMFDTKWYRQHLIRSTPNTCVRSRLTTNTYSKVISTPSKNVRILISEYFRCFIDSNDSKWIYDATSLQSQYVWHLTPSKSKPKSISISNLFWL